MRMFDCFFGNITNYLIEIKSRWDTGNEGPTRDPERYYLVHSDLDY